MRPGGGKAKGATFERLVCVALSKWVSNGERDDLFWRSAMSGGRATVGRKKGVERSAQSGDISIIDSKGSPLADVFSIECKTYEDLHLDNLVYGGKAGAPTFWTQCKRDAEQAGKLPFLVAKQNRKDILLGLSQEGMTLLQASPIASYPRHDLHLFFFEEFLTENIFMLGAQSEKKITRVRLALNRPGKG